MALDSIYNNIHTVRGFINSTLDRTASTVVKSAQRISNFAHQHPFLTSSMIFILMAGCAFGKQYQLITIPKESTSDLCKAFEKIFNGDRGIFGWKGLVNSSTDVYERIFRVYKEAENAWKMGYQDIIFEGSPHCKLYCNLIDASPNGFFSLDEMGCILELSSKL
jgi:hypothetical protein